MRRIQIVLAFLVCVSHCAAARSIADTIRIRQWLTVGPFSTAPRENSIDYLVEHGGESAITPAEGMTHTSILVPGATVVWKRTQVDSTGAVALSYDTISWDTLAQSYGTAGLMTTSYAYAEFESAVDGSALALADGVSSFRLNGMVWPGDAYRQHFVRIPVPVRKGINRVLIKQSGFAGGSFVFQLFPAPQPLIVIDRDLTLPDAIDGAALDAPAGITMVNATETPLGPITVHVGDGAIIERHDTVIEGMIPYSIIKIPVLLHSRVPMLRATTGDTIAIPLIAESRGGSASITLRVRVRSAGETRRVTFISAMDGSAQYYGVAPPLPSASSAKPGLLLSLHGASVEAQGQAEAYQRKDWAYVVAATNRRPYGFDWQDWGAQDALEVLADARSRFPVDTGRIWLAGHSMGGHGTWSVGLHHPDLFAAIAPSAGWTSFPLYMPWTLQRSAVYADPEILAIRDRALRHDNLLAFADNAAHLPAFIMHGGSDDNVPPVHARMYTEALRRAGDTVTFTEVPGMGHWWDNPNTPGTDCIDDSSLLAFLRTRSRDNWPSHVHFHTVDLGQSSGAYWVQIDQEDQPFTDATIDATVSDKKIIIETHNVAEFTVTLPPTVAHSDCELDIDGLPLRVWSDATNRVTCHKTGNRFVRVTEQAPGLRKTPALFGPMKQACFHPFVLVYGTRGDSATTALLMHKARIQAQLWWRVGNGTVQVMADSNVTAATIASKNLLLFGGPAANRVTQRLAPLLPVEITATGMRVGSAAVRGAHLATQFIYPNPEHAGTFVFVNAGTDYEGEMLAGSFNVFGSGAGLPDYMIYDARVRTLGWGGVHAAGYFDNDWKAR